MSSSVVTDAERAKIKPLPFDATRAIFLRNGLDLVQVGGLRVVVNL